MFLETMRVLPFISHETDYLEPRIFGRSLQKFFLFSFSGYSHYLMRFLICLFYLSLLFLYILL